MKTVKSILTIVVALLIFVFGFLVGERCTQFSVPAGKTLVSTAVLDSIKNLKPEIIVKDSIVFRDTTIYRDRPLPPPEPVEPDINLYIDSMVNDTTHLIIKDWVKGTIERRDIEYRPSYVLRTVREPYPVFYPEIEYKDKPDRWQFYIGGGAGSLVGAEAGAIKNNWMYGGEILTDSRERYYLFKVKRIIF